MIKFALAHPITHRLPRGDVVVLGFILHPVVLVVFGELFHGLDEAGEGLRIHKRATWCLKAGGGSRLEVEEGIVLLREFLVVEKRY